MPASPLLGTLLGKVTQEADLRTRVLSCGVIDKSPRRGEGPRQGLTSEKSRGHVRPRAGGMDAGESSFYHHVWTISVAGPCRRRLTREKAGPPPFQGVPRWEQKLKCAGCGVGHSTRHAPWGTSLEVQWLGIHLPGKGVQVSSLVRELRSHMLPGVEETRVLQLRCDAAKNKQVTNFLKDVLLTYCVPGTVLAFKVHQ